MNSDAARAAPAQERINGVLRYHERTKHRLNRYAPVTTPCTVALQCRARRSRSGRCRACCSTRWPYPPGNRRGRLLPAIHRSEGEAIDLTAGQVVHERESSEMSGSVFAGSASLFLLPRAFGTVREKLCRRRFVAQCKAARSDPRG